ncbi:MAG: DUF2273 domain-containing protein [Dermatophilaceae bacterium]|nr:DUF2273 domain-containing protein [Intrasporangiaceae bacterium]
MNIPLSGAIVGILLALAALVGGWTGFLLALVLGLVGYVVAGSLSGDVDLKALGGRERG